jgi:hypothetical protein
VPVLRHKLHLVARSGARHPIKGFDGAGDELLHHVVLGQGPAKRCREVLALDRIEHDHGVDATFHVRSLWDWVGFAIREV